MKKQVMMIMLIMVFIGIISFPSSSANTTITTNRIYGADRIETACKIAENGWSSSNTAILTRSDLFADALSGSVLAGRYDAPLLLTDKNNLSPSTLSTLKKL